MGVHYGRQSGAVTSASVTLLETANFFPPFVCRLAARKKNGWQPMSVRDIAKIANLTPSYVSVLSKKTSWNGVSIDIVQRFSEACGVDFMNPNPTVTFFRESKMIYMNQATVSQKKTLAELLRLRPNTEQAAPSRD